MTRSVRLVVFAIGGTTLAVLLVLAITRMPGFGGDVHPYRDWAVAAGFLHGTPNIVTSINFDQRGLDTFGEEAILFASVIGAVTLLRPGADERPRTPPGEGRVLAATRLAGYVLLPVTLVIGVDIVVHGHLTPGGGFQGGVVLATGLHLVYLTGSYRALRQVRPLHWYEYGEAAGMAAVAALGIAGLVVGAGFLANVLPLGTFGNLISAGTVPLFSLAVGIEVAAGVVVLLAAFLAQDLATGRAVT